MLIHTFNRKILCASIISVIFLISPFLEPVFGETNSHTVTVSSKTFAFGPATIQIDYRVIFDIQRPSEVESGDYVTISLNPRSGTMTYNISVGDKNYRIDQNVPLGTEIPFSVATGIDAYVSSSATTQVEILGPVDNRYQNLSWQSPGSKQISFYVTDTSGYNDVRIRAPINVNLDTGLNLNLIIFKQQLGEMNLGTITAYPVIDERIPIKSQVIPSSFSSGISTGLIFLIIIIIITAIVIVVIVRKGKRKNKDRSVDSSSTETKPAFSYEDVKELKEKSPQIPSNTETKPTVSQENVKEIKDKPKEKDTDSIQRETIIDKKAYSAIPITLKKGDKLMGKVAANGHYDFFVTDREHMKKFQEKKNRYYMQFYTEGKSSGGFTHEFSFTAPHEGEYLLAILNAGKMTIHVKLDYFVR